MPARYTVTDASGCTSYPLEWKQFLPVVRLWVEIARIGTNDMDRITAVAMTRENGATTVLPC